MTQQKHMVYHNGIKTVSGCCRTKCWVIHL